MRLPCLRFNKVLSMFCMLFTLQANAQAQEVIRETLTQQFPGLKIEEIVQSPINDIYQVTAGPNIIYITKDARYALSGDIIDLKNKQTNLTENVRKSARLKGLGALNKDQAIVFSPKDPKYTVTVFTDVDCGYCRKLHSEIKKLNDLGIAIRYLAFPRGGPQSPTFDKMVKIWCAPDKKQALTLAKQDKSIPNGKACDSNIIMSQFEYGMQIGVSGTPTLIFEDGSMVPGYLPPDKLLEVAQSLEKGSN